VNHRWIARGGVVALHVAVLAALWLHQPARRDDTRDRRLTTVRLVQPKPRPTPPPAAPAVAMPRAQAPALPDIPPPAFTTEPAPAAATAPAMPSTSPDTPSAEPPRTTLRLTLPPGYAASAAAARNPALSDPRSNSVKPTLESRIANAAAVTGEWVEERTSDGRMRRRRGDTCVETQESRIASIDRFNQSVAPRAAAMTGQAYKCQ
jgi:type IV secretory pathway VirB10-like protein